MTDDPREKAERYRQARWQREHGLASGDEETTDASAPPTATAQAYSAADRAAVVETAIQQAIRRGEFDDLPGAGKPLEGLGDRHDPDWWIRRKIQTEQLTGLGPPALRLRVENTELDERLDALTREDDVRDVVEDFNRRVIEARRQLQGGPPVVTPTRDVDAEVAAWRDRQRERTRDEPTDASPPRRRRWWRRPSGS